MKSNEVYWARCGLNLSGQIPMLFPELRIGARHTEALLGVRNLLCAAGLDAGNFGSAHWNPFGAMIGFGKRLVIKPNWVHHRNAAGGSLACLITNTELIEAMVEYLLLTKPHSLLIADAPVQSCDFCQLMEASGMNQMLKRMRGHRIKLGCLDLRLTRLGSKPIATGRNIDQYVRFDLREDSFLEPITEVATRFRVTRYDPGALEAAHSPGRHEYLIARELIEADCVVNMPKLKTHKKAGITGALKNLVGANGHKSFLPHHRKGGSNGGGDCYPGEGLLESCVENLLDAANSSGPAVWKLILEKASGAAIKLGRGLKPRFDVEGSWHGNDTVWRMVLDLQHILMFGTKMGSIANTPQRLLLNLTDAVLAGEGEGPLAPEPVELGLLTLGTNAAACDWIHARCMGLDPARIPLLREACPRKGSKISPFDRETIKLLPALDPPVLPFRMPEGWRGCCEAERVEALSC